MNTVMVKNSEVKKFGKSPKLDVISSYDRYDVDKFEEKFGVNNKIPYYRPTFKTLELNKLEVAEYQ